jgi:hypothetical protein
MEHGGRRPGRLIRGSREMSRLFGFNRISSGPPPCPRVRTRAGARSRLFHWSDLVPGVDFFHFAWIHNLPASSTTQPAPPAAAASDCVRAPSPLGSRDTLAQSRRGKKARATRAGRVSRPAGCQQAAREVKPLIRERRGAPPRRSYKWTTTTMSRQRPAAARISSRTRARVRCAACPA